MTNLVIEEVMFSVKIPMSAFTHMIGSKLSVIKEVMFSVNIPVSAFIHMIGIELSSVR
jgi:hypothetical protein